MALFAQVGLYFPNRSVKIGVQETRKKTKTTKEYTPKMTIIYIETTREKKQNNGLTPLAIQSELW